MALRVPLSVMPILPFPSEREGARTLMPTRKGDVVIAHAKPSDQEYSVWRVERHRQQVTRPAADAWFAIGALAAMSLARLMVRENAGGAIYSVELDTLTWTKLSD